MQPALWSVLGIREASLSLQERPYAVGLACGFRCNSRHRTGCVYTLSCSGADLCTAEHVWLSLDESVYCNESASRGTPEVLAESALQESS